MGEMFDFSRLIRKYSVPFEIVRKQEGEYMDGKYIPGEEEITEGSGAIVPLREKKKYESGGVTSEMDRQLIVSQKLPGPLEGTAIRYKNNLYQIEEEIDYSDYGNVVMYLLRWVRAFDR